MSAICEYDKVVLVKVGNDYVCNSNTVVREALSDADDATLNQNGFVIRKISDKESHIIVNRLDAEALSKASQAFYSSL